MLQEFALEVALDMFAILAKHCTAHLCEQNASKRKQVRTRSALYTHATISC